MAMTACYRNFDIPPISQGVSHSHHLVSNQQTRHHGMSLQSLQTAATTALSPTLSQLSSQQQTQKDYNIPLHVDCSVEYELPNQAKPPVGTRIEPLLMIHPCYFRKMESQRRSPFINNMPNQQSSHISQNSSMSSNSIISSNSSRALRQHSTATLLRHHNHITQTTSHHHAQLPGGSNMQLPSSTSSSTRIRSTNHQQQINLQQQIDEYVQRQIVQMSAPPPPSITYSAITNGHNTSQLNSQSTSSNNSNNNHYLAQQSQRATSTWDPYIIPNVGQHQKTVHEPPKNIQCHSSKQASHISNTIIEGGGLLCTGRWGDVIEKTSSMAAIPRDYQSGPECIPSVQTKLENQNTANNMYRNTVGKRDAMLSGGCNMYNSENTAEEVSQASNMWNNEKTSAQRKYQLDSNTNLNKVMSNSKLSSSNNNVLSATASSNFQNNHTYNSHSSAQAAQDQRHILSGKYKQYLRSQRMHPYSILPSGLTTVAAESAFSQLGAAPSMFQQVSCFNV